MTSIFVEALQESRLEHGGTAEDNGGTLVGATVPLVKMIFQAARPGDAAVTEAEAPLIEEAPAALREPEMLDAKPAQPPRNGFSFRRS